MVHDEPSPSSPNAQTFPLAANQFLRPQILQDIKHQR